VAEALGVREETVHQWERGRVRPLPRHHGAILRFLGYDPEPSGSTLCGRLKALRRRLGLTQVQVTTHLRIDEGTVEDLERGRRWPSDRVRRKVRLVAGGL
jgi:DNA-binding transcriptional regulator YiaG